MEKAPALMGQVENGYADTLAAVTEYKEKMTTEVVRLQDKVRMILSKVKKGKLALWGAGIHTSKLMSVSDLSTTNLSCIFDNDTKKHGQTLSGVKIVPFDFNSLALETDIDAILISTKAAEEDVYRQIVFLEEHTIRIFRLYDDAN